MEAIEFVTNAEDGMIKIPKKYLKDLPSEFRIIILINNEGIEKKEAKKKRLTSLKIKTKGLAFDREEANINPFIKQ